MTHFQTPSGKKCMTKISCWVLIFLPLLSFAAGDRHQDVPARAVGVQALSADLRILLTQEMQALQQAMTSIVQAYIAGNWQDIANTAKQMKDSYILEQSLTEHQAKELQSTLSSAFIAKDQHFHYLAGMLEHAAKNKKPEMINFYFAEMNESCLACHSEFATHRFPALVPNETAPAHSH